jgi:hypothetical protein
MIRMAALIEKMSKARALSTRDGGQPRAFAARLRRSALRVTMTDGPFAETKEHVG